MSTAKTNGKKKQTPDSIAEKITSLEKIISTVIDDEGVLNGTTSKQLSFLAKKLLKEITGLHDAIPNDMAKTKQIKTVKFFKNFTSAIEAIPKKEIFEKKLERMNKKNSSTKKKSGLDRPIIVETKLAKLIVEHVKSLGADFKEPAIGEDGYFLRKTLGTILADYFRVNGLGGKEIGKRKGLIVPNDAILAVFDRDSIYIKKTNVKVSKNASKPTVAPKIPKEGEKGNIFAMEGINPKGFDHREVHKLLKYACFKIDQKEYEKIKDTKKFKEELERITRINAFFKDRTLKSNEEKAKEEKKNAEKSGKNGKAKSTKAKGKGKEKKQDDNEKEKEEEV